MIMLMIKHYMWLLLLHFLVHTVYYHLFWRSLWYERAILGLNVKERGKRARQA